MAITNIKKKRRMRAILFITLIIFIALVIRIGWIQFMQKKDGKSLQQLAYTQQTLSSVINPKRGVIYDSTGKVLAMSWSVETVRVNPMDVSSKNKEKLAKALSEIFAVDYEKTLTKLNNKSFSETIVKRVEKEKTDELRQWMKDNDISAGISIDEDTKRYYPYNEMAASLIGFCGDDNQGLSGLEIQYDSVLRGTSGKIEGIKNAVGQAIPNEEEKRIPPENGSNLVLTIDSNIQAIAEKYLKQAVIDNKCTDGGNIIVMNPKNGDILALAEYPDFNANTPFEPNTDTLKNRWGTMSSADKTAELQQMWRSKAVSDTYEPGSTFKIITAAASLEEGIVTPDKAGEFHCSTVNVSGVKINCWRSPMSHGSESLRQGLGNSCNPVFITLRTKIRS